LIARLKVKMIRRVNAVTVLQRWARMQIARQQLKYLKTVNKFKRKKTKVIQLSKGFQKHRYMYGLNKWLRVVSLARNAETI
jgi:hypothetical protein